jgi:hypothetical protein
MWCWFLLLLFDSARESGLVWHGCVEQRGVTLLAGQARSILIRIQHESHCKALCYGHRISSHQVRVDCFLGVLNNFSKRPSVSHGQRHFNPALVVCYCCAQVKSRSMV